MGDRRTVVVVDPRFASSEVLATIGTQMQRAGLEATVTVAGAGVRRVAGTSTDDDEVGLLVAAGDDGTTSEVANAILEQGRGSSIALGVVPLAPSDFPRTFGLPQDPVAACRHLGGRAVYELDAARVQGEAGARWFLSVTEVGFGARLAASRRRGTGGVRSFAAFWSALARSKEASVVMEGEQRTHELSAWTMVLANGQFGSGGLRVSPRSNPGDGVLDVLVMHGPRSDAFTMLRDMHRGDHIPSPHIATFKSRAFRIRTTPAMPVAVDGVPFGETPLDVRVDARALRLKV